MFDLEIRRGDKTHYADLIKGLGFVGVVLFVSYHTSIAWGGTLVILTIGQFVSQCLIITKIHESQADIFWVKVKQGEPCLEVDQGKLSAYTSQWKRLVGMYYCVAALYAIVVMLIIKPTQTDESAYFFWFIGHFFWIAALFLFYVLVIDKAWGRVGVKVKESLGEREKALRADYHEVLKKFEGVTAIHEKFGLDVHGLYDDEIEDFLNENMAAIIHEGSVPCEALASIAKEINDDHAPLVASADRYEAIVKKTKHVVLETVVTDFIGLEDEINGYSKHLKSEEFLSNLKHRDFDTFNQYLDFVDDGLDTILAAIERKEADRVRKNRVLGRSGQERMTDKQRAYQLLALPENASMAEVKSQYRKMAQEYHPDRAEQTTVGIREIAQDRFIEIKWAYGVLRVKR